MKITKISTAIFIFFFCIIGCRGKTGPQGPQGRQGAPGAPGAAGGVSVPPTFSLSVGNCAITSAAGPTVWGYTFDQTVTNTSSNPIVCTGSYAEYGNIEMLCNASGDENESPVISPGATLDLGGDCISLENANGVVVRWSVVCTDTVTGAAAIGTVNSNPC